MLNLADIAAASNLSVVYFRKLFTAAYNILPMRFVVGLRVAHAKTLLAERGMTVTHIAAECGYSDIFCFSSAFKKHTGFSPTGYMEHIYNI